MLERWMMRYLRKRGWVVFWLDEWARQCTKEICWMGMWEIDRLRKEKKKLNESLPHALRGIAMPEPVCPNCAAGMDNIVAYGPVSMKGPFEYQCSRCGHKWEILLK